MDKEELVAKLEILEEPTTSEKLLATEVHEISNIEQIIRITNEDEYKGVCDVCKVIKAKEKEIRDFFAPLKESAHKAHADICAREKEMIEPLRAVESRIKCLTSEYLETIEKERQEAEERARAMLLRLSEEQLRQSAEFEKQGDTEEAQRQLDNAVEISERSQYVVVNTKPTAKVDGVSTRKDYEIEFIDESKVPISVMGAVIRPVDEKAILKLIRASNGQIQIDGVKYKQTIKTIFRSDK